MLPELAAEPIIAVRSWNLIDESLRGWAYLDRIWPAKEAMKATCLLLETEYSCTSVHGPVPHETGKCGIYGVRLSHVRYIEPRRVDLAGAEHVGRFLYWWSPSDSPVRNYLVHLETHANEVGRGYAVVAGLVALWGKVIVGSNGVYRAQYGYPIALFDGLYARAVAKLYAVPIVDVPTSPEHLITLGECARRLLWHGGT